MNTKLFEKVHYFGTPWKDLFAQFILASIGFTLSGSSPTMSSMLPEAPLFNLFSFPRVLRCLRHLELPRVRRRHARQRDTREFKHLRETYCQWNRAFDSTFHSSIDHRIWCLITQRSVDDTYLQRSRSTHRDIDRAS